MSGGLESPGEVEWPSGDEWRRRLAAEGFRPSRRLGQNFLVDPARCDAIAALAEPLSGCFVLEIGVGLGFLTRHLLARGARVFGVELDRRLADLSHDDLVAQAEAGGGSYELLVADALATKSTLAPELVAALPLEGDWQVVSNLPYAVASPLLVLLARTPRPPSAMTALVQLEVAARLAAVPRSPDYGALSVRLQAAYTVRVALRVPPGAFRPRPKVDSAVVRMVRRFPAPSPSALSRLDAVTSAAFAQRRKRLRNNLGASLPGGVAEAEELCRRAEVDPAVRAEELDLAAFGRLGEVWPEDVGPPVNPAL